MKNLVKVEQYQWCKQKYLNEHIKATITTTGHFTGNMSADT